MITSLIATVVIVVTTNTYQPTQYLDTSYGCLVYGCTDSHERWVDSKPIQFGWTSDNRKRERANPDVRITEVHEIKRISFEFEGKEWGAEISNILLSTKRQKRTVTTDESWTDE